MPTRTSRSPSIASGAKRAVLFDLDGTLLDTAPDLAYCLNELLAQTGRPRLGFEDIRPVVSHGGIGLIRLGFGLEPEHPPFAELRQRLLELYRENLARNTRLFPGMDAVLDELEDRGIQWGVVTNKPGWLTEPLLQALGLLERAASVVSGDTLPQRKPHPAPLLRACGETGCTAPQCVYVGDAERDILAGRTAGMHTVVALFGYIGADEDPRAWGADAVIAAPAELLDWLDENFASAV
ncbi:MAG TPA: phosphoglycolate phosphatase [Gammaproteobacteria bacterium]|nr:phosphoglycolate phosphatase [Gammaproteobacteria bacterium]